MMQTLKSLLSEGLISKIIGTTLGVFLSPLYPLLQKLRLYIHGIEFVILTFVAKLWFFMFEKTNFELGVMNEYFTANEYRIQKKITKHRKIARLVYVLTVRILNYFGLAMYTAENNPEKINYFLEGRRTLIHSICLKKVQRQVEKNGEKAIWVDFGSGDGALIDFLSNQEIEKNFSKIFLVEPCTELNNLAEKRIKARKINKEKTQIHFVNKTAKQFIESAAATSNLKNNVDFVTFCYSLTMMDDWFDNLELTRKVLKENGKGFIAVLDFYVSKKYAMPEDAYFYQRPRVTFSEKTEEKKEKETEKEKEKEKEKNENSEEQENSSSETSEKKEKMIEKKRPINLLNHGSFARHCIPFLASLVTDGIISISDDHLPFLISRFDSIWLKEGEWNLGPLGVFPLNWIIPNFLSMKISFLFSVPYFMYIGQTKQANSSNSSILIQQSEENEEKFEEKVEKPVQKIEKENEQSVDLALMMSQLRKEVEQLKQVVSATKPPQSKEEAMSQYIESKE